MRCPECRSHYDASTRHQCAEVRPAAFPAGTGRTSLDEVAQAKLEQHDEASAQRDAAMASLAALCGILTKIGGYMTPEQQQALRAARALLAESAR